MKDLLRSLVIATLLISFAPAEAAEWRENFALRKTKLFVRSDGKTHEAVSQTSFTAKHSLEANLKLLTTDLKKLNQARQAVMSAIGYQGYRLHFAKKIPGGLEVYAQFRRGDKTVQTVERLIFEGTRVYQTTYAKDGTKPIAGSVAKKIFARFPAEKKGRAIASEIASSDTWSQAPEQLAASPKCQSVPEELRVTAADKDVNLGTVANSIGGCAQGLWNAGGDILNGLWNLMVGGWQFATDGAYRDQVMATYGAIAAEFGKDPAAYTGAVLNNFREAVQVYYAEFPCYNSAAQTQMVCNLITKILAPALVVKILARVKLTDIEMKELREGMVRAAQSIAGIKSVDHYLGRSIRSLPPSAPHYLRDVGDNRWWTFPRRDIQYPVLIDPKDADVVQAMLKGQSVKGGPHTFVDELRDEMNTWGIEGHKRLYDAANGPELQIGGQTFKVAGAGFADLRVVRTGDFNPMPETQRNLLSGVEFMKGTKFMSLEPHQGVPRWSESINGQTVRVVVGDKYVEGEYLSAGGRDLPRGASPNHFHDKDITAHFVKVNGQILAIPAEGTRLFLKR